MKLNNILIDRKQTHNTVVEPIQLADLEDSALVLPILTSLGSRQKTGYIVAPRLMHLDQ
ncbi:hypothetical protein GGS24DRAFT_440017 [Hypoxylon argillaceum]|nr:hypothetical protein GGS24DRAFT_440017 [Hypoxylon argillaceum]